MIQSRKKENEVLTLGILGGGQLAKMTLQAAARMGLNIAIIEKGISSPAGKMTKYEFPLGWLDTDELDKFIEQSDVVTLENEFISPEILEYIEKKLPVFPSSSTMRLIQDKYVQKSTFSQAGIKMADFAKLENESNAKEFGESFGYPFLIKTRTNGYDGYGNFTIKTKEDITLAFDKFHQKDKSIKLMAESFVKFTKELAVMVARNKKGQVVVYPCVETIQENHICHKVIAPARISEDIQLKSQELAIRCVEAIDGIGIFGIELFLTDKNEVLFNEIAPRPHNSGHYTIEACVTSQFENHLRAVLDLPLGSTKMIKQSAIMINLLGEKEGSGYFSEVDEVLESGVALHLYGKAQSRKGRKMGHITAIGNSYEETDLKINKGYESIKW